MDVTAPGRSIPDDFLGVSVEWNNVALYLGDGTGRARAETATLLGAFAAEGHRPEIRVGGNSEDLSWWNPDGLPRPDGVLYDIRPVDLDTLADLQARVGNRLVLGLNLALADADNAAQLMRAARAVIPEPGLRAFELGNEPDVFVSAGHRPDGYDWAAYLSDVGRFRDAIAAQFTDPLRFQWPAVARRSWLDDVVAQIPAERDRIAVVSTHTYPYTVCEGLPAPRPDSILSEHATSEIAAAYASVAQAAHDAGLPYRMGELNSVSCGGGLGISDVYASALWSADMSMQLASIGADGVNFHGGAPPGMQSIYAAFVFDSSGAPLVRPLYYGLRLVSLVTAAHGRLLPVTVSAPASPSPIHAFATLGDDGAVRILVLRMSANGSDTVRVSATGSSAGTATLVRMRAPSLDSSSGLSLGGLTWDGSEDGSPVGMPEEESLVTEGGAFSFELPPYDAVVITIR